MKAEDIVYTVESERKKAYLAGFNIIEIRMPSYMIDMLKAYCKHESLYADEENYFVGRLLGIPVIQKEGICKIQYVIEEKDDVDLFSIHERMMKLEYEQILKSATNNMNIRFEESKENQ